MEDRFKFRAWDNHLKQYFDDVQDEYDDQVECFGYMLNDSCKDRYVVEQCTGFKDKTGQLIFEGDIVEYKISGAPNKSKDVVSYNHQSCSYHKGGSLLSTYPKTIKIIGNIHENPELLRKSYERD